MDLSLYEGFVFCFTDSLLQVVVEKTLDKAKNQDITLIEHNFSRLAPFYLIFGAFESCREGLL